MNPKNIPGDTQFYVCVKMARSSLPTCGSPRALSCTIVAQKRVVLVLCRKLETFVGSLSLLCSMRIVLQPGIGQPDGAATGLVAVSSTSMIRSLACDHVLRSKRLLLRVLFVVSCNATLLPVR